MTATTAATTTTDKRRLAWASNTVDSLSNHLSLRKQSKQVRDQIQFLVGRVQHSTKRRFLINNICQPIFHRAGRHSLLKEREYRFWTSWTACFVYAILGLALLSRRCWMLRGILAALLLQVSWIILKWIVYTVEDPALRASVNFLSTWLRRFVKEGESILSGASGTKLVFAGVVAYNASTGMGYLRAIIRYKMSVINQTAQNEFAARQFRRSVPSIRDHVSRVTTGAQAFGEILDSGRDLSFS